MKSSDINYYELTDEEIQAYKDDIKLNTFNKIKHMVLSDSDVKHNIHYAYFYVSRSAKDHMIGNSRNSAMYKLKKYSTSFYKPLELQKYGCNFYNLHGFDDSEELLVHLIMIHNPEFLITLHEKYHTIDRVLCMYKKIGMNKIASVFKDFEIKDEIADDPYFQRELRKLKMIAP
ncbi:hypothetical protein J7J47_03715 [Halomonas sp. ISL-60]|uniref:hypothetical protein n=1 Tax=Halomonas sp. ISL-56 TaxID=2819149 RepID=UPI001BEC90D2|nr:hypothetical protein [Halomonas sp. ISL-56]MBT2771337.1 hypothetical protein [Halomonas sp. ISL-60]MBT2800694.1 hypothetical protein [Halomonas sp. ISL-56]